MSIVSASPGSAGAPGFTFDGDTNTGMFSPGADTWAVTTGGSERLRVRSDGTVASPRARPPLR